MNSRNHWWDWLKLFAALAMVLDHLRFVSPAFSVLVWPGRVAMPLFASICALNFSRSKNKDSFFKRLLPFAVFSELPYALLMRNFGNVLLFFVLAFAFLQYGKIIFAVAACSISYSVGGLGALWLFAGAFTVPSFFLGGLLLNGFPSSLLSGFVGVLPVFTISAPPCPFVGGNALLWFYPLHLSVLWLCRVIFC